MKYNQLPFRSSDQRVFVADYKKMSILVGWQPNINSNLGINLLLNKITKKN